VVDISTAPLSAEDIGEASVHGDLLDSSECMLLTDLPPHLVHTICSYLEAKDISRLSQACKCTERATRTLRVTQMHQKMSQLRRDFTSAEERARKAEGLISRQAPVVELVTRVQYVGPHMMEYTVVVRPVWFCHGIAWLSIGLLMCW